MLAELATELSLDLLELDGRHVDTRPAIDLRLVADDLAAKGLGEAADGLAEVALEELDDRRGEVQLVRALEHVLLLDSVLDHPLREVADYFVRWRDLKPYSAVVNASI